MRVFDLDVLVTRGGGIESRHRVHAAVVDASDALVGRAREPGTVTMWRSCAKPFQVMPLIASGGFDEIGWGDDELTLACASHGGEPEHVALAESMLRDLGLEEGDLACGPHEPLSPRGARILRESGDRPTRLHNNCSGKHAAMLARASIGGWPAEGYERDDHPVQRGALDEVARWTGVSQDRILLAVDGCGVVVFGLPLDAMARAYARLATAAARGDEIPARITRAISTRPFLFGGTDRFDSLLVEETGGRVISKIGAEGVHSVAVFDQRLGFAIKVEDGATRAQYPAVLHMLALLGALPERLSPRLAEYARTRIRNTRGEVVGELLPASA
jgi:L-asparaginase II